MPRLCEFPGLKSLRQGHGGKAPIVLKREACPTRIAEEPKATIAIPPMPLQTESNPKAKWGCQATPDSPKLYLRNILSSLSLIGEYGM